LSTVFLLAPLPSCTGPSSHEHDIAETPQPIPEEVDEPTPPKNEGESSSDPAAPEDCGHTTGRNAEGVCESLHTRELEHAQQVMIPAGRFVMGDVPRSYAAGIGRHDPRERWPGQPPRYVETPGFWIDFHEVTRAAYAQCVEAGSCSLATCPDGVDPVEKFSKEAAANFPQTCITHQQAEGFCLAQNSRLPTEVEWEYASRGVDARVYPWGNNMRDEYGAMLLPISGTPGDSSYFGIRGLGTNATEWVADPYLVDAGLKDFLRKPFRRSDGPLTQAEATRGPRFVMKGGKAGARRDQIGADRRLGFRCAADLASDDEELTAPELPPSIPLLRDTGTGLLVFGGVAEAVDRREAESFCDAVGFEFESQTYEGWRLPTLAEVQTIAADFRGPGPFWAADGAVIQKGETARQRPDDPWISEAAESGEALAARCVRDHS